MNVGQYILQSIQVWLEIGGSGHLTVISQRGGATSELYTPQCLVDSFELDLAKVLSTGLLALFVMDWVYK